VGVALLGRRLDGEQPHGRLVLPAARRAEPAATVGVELEVAAVPAVAVQVDETPAPRALAHPVAMVAARGQMTPTHTSTVGPTGRPRLDPTASVEIALRRGYLTHMHLAPGERSRQPGAVPAQGQAPVRVLVVDDSEVFRNVMAVVVASTPGFEVAGRASSGREALHLVEELAPDLVLLDVWMPDMDGIETARRIRRHYPDVVILLLTATRQAYLHDPALTVEDKRELSSEWLVDFWRRQEARS
jgi:CheY-like chemotaxis protein